jgi:hypothetical protein
VEKTEDLIKDLTAKLQQMDEDLSQNNPQVFAEYDNATPAMITDMENRFTELRKLAYTETERQWYNEHISVMESLLDVFRNQMTSQHKVKLLVRGYLLECITNIQLIGSRTLEAKDRLPDQAPSPCLKETTGRRQRFGGS